MMRHKGLACLLTLSYNSDKCQQHTLLAKLSPKHSHGKPTLKMLQHNLTQEDVAVMAEPDTVL